MNEDEEDYYIDLNFRSVYWCVKYQVAQMRKQGGGAIVNIGDLYAERPRADLVAYAASKAALLGLTRGLAVALAREGGMGVIHRACPIAEQASMVSRVKRSENAVILKPLTVRKEQTIDEIILNPLSWYAENGITLHAGVDLGGIGQQQYGFHRSRRGDLREPGEVSPKLRGAPRRCTDRARMDAPHQQHGVSASQHLQGGP